jgi:hypothetical protein
MNIHILLHRLAPLSHSAWSTDLTEANVIFNFISNVIKFLYCLDNMSREIPFKVSIYVLNNSVDRPMACGLPQDRLMSLDDRFGGLWMVHNPPRLLSWIQLKTWPESAPPAPDPLKTISLHKS